MASKKPAAKNTQPTYQMNVVAHMVVKRKQNPLAAIGVEMPGMQYFECDNCHLDLSEWSQNEQIGLSNVNKCPQCKSTFVPLEKVYCYACGTKMPSSGVCPNCDATYADPVEFKAMYLLNKQENPSMKPRALKALTKGMMDDDGEVQAALAKAKAGKWIETAEAGGGSTQGSPFRA